MRLTGLHLLLTYQCNFECDHCFVWGSPWQHGTMTLAQIQTILDQGHTLGSVTWIYFEGGEPFLYHPILVEGVRRAVDKGFQVGIVSNGYWATSPEDALTWLTPLAGLVQDLSISSDLYHYSEEQSQHAQNARAAAGQLDIPIGTISIAQPEAVGEAAAVGQLPPGVSAVMFRGRAAHRLVERAPRSPWEQFDTCPHEDLAEPGRVHIDPFGNVHLCQGLVAGNLFKTPLQDICQRYDPWAHPICGPLLQGGPAALVRRYALPHAQQYADACHLCYEARTRLRDEFPNLLGPDPMYGVGV